MAQALVARGHDVQALVRRESVPRLKGSGVEPLEGDLRDREAVAKATKGCQAVFHVAALYALWWPRPQEMYEVNVEGTRNVLEAARASEVERIVHTSTVGTVHLPGKGALGNEEHDAAPRELVGHYKRSKFLAEMEARRAADQGMSLVVVNPTAPVGSHDVKPTPTGKMVLDFLRGRIPAYIHTGLNLVDVVDVAAGHVLAMEKGQTGRRYLLGNLKGNLTLRQILEMLASITGRRVPRLRLPRWLALAAACADGALEGGLLRRQPRIPLEGVRMAGKLMWVDCSRAVTELGLPQTPVEQALEKAARWFVDNGYVPRKRSVQVPG